MYIYKFIITFASGEVRNEWISCEAGESLSTLKERANRYMDDLESDESVAAVKMTRRTVPGI